MFLTSGAAKTAKTSPIVDSMPPWLTNARVVMILRFGAKLMMGDLPLDSSVWVMLWDYPGDDYSTSFNVS